MEILFWCDMMKSVRSEDEMSRSVHGRLRGNI